MGEDVAGLSDDELCEEIRTWGARVAAGEARLLRLIAECDRREAWRGFLSCAHWLSHWLGLGMTAARERVRVARALTALPLVSEALAVGRMSYAQARAVTRVASADDEPMWLEVASTASGSQLERLCRGVGRAVAAVTDAHDPDEAEHRYRSSVTYDPDGTMVLTVRARAEDGAVLLAALRQAEDVIAAERAGDDASAEAPAEDSDASAEARPAWEPPRRRRVSMGDCLMWLVREGLEHLGSEHPRVARRRRSMLTVLVDPVSGSGRTHGGEWLTPEMVAAVADQAGLRSLPPGAGDLTVHDLGRSSRVPSLSLRELVGQVDGECCRIPGCDRRVGLQAHHVRWWSRSGPTDLANLILVCHYHHRLIHQQHWELVLTADRRLRVSLGDGTPLTAHPALLRASAEALPRATADTLEVSRHATVRLDLHYAGSVLAARAA